MQRSEKEVDVLVEQVEQVPQTQVAQKTVAILPTLHIDRAVAVIFGATETGSCGDVCRRSHNRAGICASVRSLQVKLSTDTDPQDLDLDDTSIAASFALPHKPVEETDCQDLDLDDTSVALLDKPVEETNPQDVDLTTENIQISVPFHANPGILDGEVGPHPNTSVLHTADASVVSREKGVPRDSSLILTTSVTRRDSSNRALKNDTENTTESRARIDRRIRVHQHVENIGNTFKSLQKQNRNM